MWAGLILLLAVEIYPYGLTTKKVMTEYTQI